MQRHTLGFLTLALVIFVSVRGDSIPRGRPGLGFQTKTDSHSHSHPHSHPHSHSHECEDDDLQHASNRRDVGGNADSSCTHGLCVNVTTYPKQRIEQLLSRSNFLSKSFFESVEEVIHVNNRFGDKETSMCETMVHTIYPETATNINKVEKIIVNVEGHKQGVLVETCIGNDKPCKFSSNFPIGYKAMCQQKFLHKKLMVMEGDNIVFDSFEIPSCCVCIIKEEA